MLLIKPCAPFSRDWGRSEPCSEPRRIPGRESSVVKSLLILSSFGHASRGYGQREAFWCHLQQRFIASTTDDYDYAVYLNRVDRGLFPSALIVGENNGPRTSLETQITLKSLLEYARSRPYAHYLILDSDAFPVRRGWVELLLNKMGECRFAAPVRYE